MYVFEQLVDAHYQALYRFAQSLGVSPDRASDSVQRTFCVWAAKVHQLRDKSKAKTWVFTTLHRKFLSPARVAEFLAELDENFRTRLTLLCLQLHSAKEMLRWQMTAGPSSEQKNILRMEPETLKNQHG